MRKARKLHLVLTIVLCCAVATTMVFANQQGQRGQRGQGGQAGGQGFGGQGQRGQGFDRAAMQERMLQMMQEQLGATDEEWQVISPRLSEVMELQQSANAGGRGMRGMMGNRRGNRGGPAAADQTEPTDPVQKATQDLQETLDKEAPSSTEIKNKLDALRGAREQARQKLAAAQKNLRDVLSVKQEAQLVLMGMLD